MKPKNPLLFTLLLPLLFFGIQMVKAQNIPAGASQNQSILSGSRLKSEDVTTKVDAVFIGEIEEIGFPTTLSPGALTYHGVKVKVLQVLRGSVGAEVTVTLYAERTSNVREQAPKVSGTYIFFIKQTPGWNIVHKLLPATDDNIAKVKQLIAAAPAPASK